MSAQGRVHGGVCKAMQQGGVEVLFISLWSEPGGRCTMIMIHKSFLGVPGEDGLDPNTAAEIELQEMEAAWLEQEKITDYRRRKQKRRKTGGTPYRQKSWRWVIEPDNALQMRPFNTGGLKPFQVPEGWQQMTGGTCLAWLCLVLSADQGPDCWCGQRAIERLIQP